ncbi:MAG: 50S ribosomal protein L3 [Bacilli bacterium]|nr:50S ribosomal protein L3 [Bacilli bacterium]
MKQLIGRKLGMTQIFATDGTQYAVSVIEVLPNVITRIKTEEKDGYKAYVVGYDSKKESRANKCEKGFSKKSNTPLARFYREVTGKDLDALNLTVGGKLDASIFKAGDIVDVIGTSKGKGYTGTIKRYHHTIGPKGHGSGYHRQVGSFANNGRCNNRVLPGKKMSGHRGFEQATILNLLVVETNAEKGYILVKGAIPGAKQSLVKIRSAIRTQLGKPQQVKPLVDLSAKKEQPKAVEAPKAEAKPAPAPKPEVKKEAAPKAAPAKPAEAPKAAPKKEEVKKEAK